MKTPTNILNNITNQQKTAIIKIQHFFHDTLWSRYFLPGILSLVLIITLVQLIYFNIFNPPNPEIMLPWRMWVIFTFSTIGTFSGLCGTYFVNRRSIKWVYFQFVTIPALVLALAFSLLPLQALMWAGMVVPAVLMYRVWNKQLNSKAIEPQKLCFKLLASLFLLAIIISLVFGFSIKAIDKKLAEFELDIAPIADAFILVFTLFAPFILAKRYWAGQYFFIVANIVSILLFSGAIGPEEIINPIFVVQNLVLLFFAFVGISSWVVVYKQQHTNY